MSRFRVVRVGLSGVALILTEGCVSDHTLEDNVIPSIGATQPDGSASGAVAAAAACDRIKTARSGAATKLGCDAPKDACPALLLLAGSVACDEFAGGSIAACEAEIGTYGKCSDFDTKPCVVTPISTSCHTLPPLEAGTHPKHDGGVTREDGSVKPRDGGVKPKDAAKSG